MNIYDECESDGIVFKKNSSTHGGVYCSECPFCGGDDRFVIWPNEKNGGRYWCRKCERKGDLIQYLRDFREMTFIDACDYSGYKHLLNRHSGNYKPKKLKKTAVWEPVEVKYPTNHWQEKALAFVKFTIDTLWHYDEGLEIQDWLNKKRCLNDNTIKEFQFGFLHQQYYRERDTWGLEKVKNEDGSNRKLFLPPGLVIPFTDYGDVLRLRIRRPAGESPKYYIVPGSSMHPFFIGYHSCKEAIVVESELDAILLSQELKGEVLIIALGAVKIRPDKRLTAALAKINHILIALDNDEVCNKEYNNFWKINFTRSIQHNIPDGYGTDPTEAMLIILELHHWYLIGVVGF